MHTISRALILVPLMWSQPTTSHAERAVHSCAPPPMKMEQAMNLVRTYMKGAKSAWYFESILLQCRDVMNVWRVQIRVRPGLARVLDVEMSGSVKETGVLTDT